MRNGQGEPLKGNLGKCGLDALMPLTPAHKPYGLLCSECQGTHNPQGSRNGNLFCRQKGKYVFIDLFYKHYIKYIIFS